MLRFLSSALMGGGVVFVWAQFSFMRLENERDEARADARYAQESEQRLLSKGRWVRDIDPKSGISTYRYARNKEQR